MDQPWPRREAPNFTDATLDFSDFHDLMHPLWRCSGYGRGGWRTHIIYYWRYIGSERWRARTVCHLGRHRWVVWYSRDPDDADQMIGSDVACRDCGQPADTATATAVLIEEEEQR